jgi:hypothetical protein
MNIKPEEVTPTVDALGFDVASSSATRLIKFYRHHDLHFTAATIALKL